MASPLDISHSFYVAGISYEVVVWFLQYVFSKKSLDRALFGSFSWMSNVCL